MPRDTVSRTANVGTVSLTRMIVNDLLLVNDTVAEKLFRQQSSEKRSKVFSTIALYQLKLPIRI